MALFGFAKKVIKHPAYSVATSLVPNLDLSGSATSALGSLLHLTPGGTASDLLNTALRAGGGYLQGGKRGAALGALGGFLNNYQPASNWVNNLSNYGALGGALENFIQGGVKATGNAANPLIGGGMGLLSSLFPSLATAPNLGQGTVSTGWNSSIPNPAVIGTSTSSLPGGSGASVGGAGAGTGTGTPAGASGSGSALSSLLAALGKLPGGAQLALGAGALGALGGLLGNSNHSGSGSTAGPNPPPLWGSETTGSSGPGYNYANYGGAGYFPRQAVSPIAQSDYYTYGQRPEQLFFENAPAAIAPTTTGMKRGGALRSVSYIRGAGSGRSDTVPIKGSPGEYMMDAETVSLLGDGNNEAGARKLDQMRKQIRRHKGKALARGKFSPNAKLPVQYMGAR